MLTQEQHPCWAVICDHCGEGDNLDYSGSIHYQSENDARLALRDLDWRVLEDGRALHAHCFEELRATVLCPHGSFCTGGGCGCCPTAVEVFGRMVTP